MASFTQSMNVSLDGYVDHDRFQPDDGLFRHWIGQVQGCKAGLYGRRMYEIMRYWDADDEAWTDDRRAFAEAWRAQRKWVVSTTLTEAGPNAEIVSDDVEAAIREIGATHEGEIPVCGTGLAQTVAGMGLMDEYRLYYHPVVLGHGTPFFAGPRPPLRLVGSDRIGAAAIRLRFVPA